MTFFAVAVTILFLRLGATPVAAEEKTCQEQFNDCFYACEQYRKYGGSSDYWTCYPACATQKDECEASSTGVLDESCEAQREECNVPCYNMLKWCPEHCPYSACFNACARRSCDDDPEVQDSPEPPVRDCQSTFNTCFYVCEQQRKFCSSCDVPGCYIGCAEDKTLCDEEQGITDAVLGTSCNETLIDCADTCLETHGAESDQRDLCHIDCADDKADCNDEDPITPVNIAEVQDCQENFDSCFKTCNTLLKFCYTCDIASCYTGCAKDKNECDYGKISPQAAAETCGGRLEACTEESCLACADCDNKTLEDCNSGCLEESNECLKTARDDPGGSSAIHLRMADVTSFGLGLVATALGIALY